MITLKLAQEKHIAELVTLEDTCFTTDKLKKRQFKHFINSKTNSLLVLTENNHVIGSGLMLYRKNSTIARLYSIAIDPKHQQKGLAQKIHRKLLSEAKQHHCTEIRLEVRKDNHPAISFYKKLNYQLFDEYKHFYEDGADALRMKFIIQ